VATTPERRLDEMFETTVLASKAFHKCAKTDPLKQRLADAFDDAEANFGTALTNGLAGNSQAIEGAVQELDHDNIVARKALATTKTTAEILAALQKALATGVKLLALVG
jgi:hypothetical protein